MGQSIKIKLTYPIEVFPVYYYYFFHPPSHDHTSVFFPTLFVCCSHLIGFFALFPSLYAFVLFSCKWQRKVRRNNHFTFLSVRMEPLQIRLRWQCGMIKVRKENRHHRLNITMLLCYDSSVLSIGNLAEELHIHHHSKAPESCSHLPLIQ